MKKTVVGSNFGLPNSNIRVKTALNFRKDFRGDTLENGPPTPHTHTQSSCPKILNLTEGIARYPRFEKAM